jgi:accessory gene regulator B
MIDKLAYITAKYLAKFITDTTSYSQMIAKRKNKQYKQLTIEEVIGLMTYSLQAIYGEIMKMILIFIFASFLHILIPTLIITFIFSTLRLMAGGVHMDTFFNCLGLTTILFIGGGLIVHNIVDINFIQNNISYIVLIEGILSLSLVYKYAPRDTQNKRIKDINKIKMFKRLSIIFVTIINIILIILALYQYNLIVLSVICGLLIEVFTITPIGVRIFNYIERKLNKIFNINIKEDNE